jgi:hypothetical protein
MKKLLEICFLGIVLIMLNSCDYLEYRDCKKALMKDYWTESEAALKCRK